MKRPHAGEGLSSRYLQATHVVVSLCCVQLSSVHTPIVGMTVQGGRGLGACTREGEPQVTQRCVRGCGCAGWNGCGVYRMKECCWCCLCSSTQPCLFCGRVVSSAPGVCLCLCRGIGCSKAHLVCACGGCLPTTWLFLSGSVAATSCKHPCSAHTVLQSPAVAG